MRVLPSFVACLLDGGFLLRPLGFGGQESCTLRLGVGASLVTPAVLLAGAQRAS